MGDLLGAIFGGLFSGIGSAFGDDSGSGSSAPAPKRNPLVFQPMSGGAGLFKNVEPAPMSRADRDREADELKKAFSVGAGW